MNRLQNTVFYQLGKTLSTYVMLLSIHTSHNCPCLKHTFRNYTIMEGHTLGVCVIRSPCQTSVFCVAEVQRAFGITVSLTIFIGIRSDLTTKASIQCHTQTQVFPSNACRHRSHELWYQATHFFRRTATLRICRTEVVVPCQYSVAVFIFLRHSV